MYSTILWKNMTSNSLKDIGTESSFRESVVDLDVLDNIIKIFFSKYSLSWINSKPVNYFDTKRYIKIKYFSDKKYQASIHNKYWILLNDTTHRQLTIKLYFDGFICSLNKKADNVQDKDTFCFIRLLAKETNSRIEYSFDIKTKTADIRLFVSEQTTPYILIRLGHGNPCHVPNPELMF